MRRLIFAILALALIACGKSGTQVTGKLSNAKEKMVYLEKIESGIPVTVDSAKTDADGNFSLTLPENGLSFYRIKVDAKNFIVLALDSSNNAEITGDAKNLYKTYTVKGSPHSELIVKFFREVDPVNEQIFKLEEQAKGMNLADTAAFFALQDQHQKLVEKRTEIAKKYVDANPKSPALLFTQSYFISNNPAVAPNMEYVKKIEKALAASMPNSEFHSQVATYISQYEYQKKQMEDAQKQQAQAMDNLRQKLAPGSVPPDINYPDPSGKNIALSSLKGKVVLVDFWASWCRPCRAENPNVVRLYDKYHSKGFEVYSVSLDKSKEAWQNAIQADGLKWSTHVSELNEWKSSVVAQYGFQGIPFTVLVGRDGKIIDVALRGSALEEKLKEIFGS